MSGICGVFRLDGRPVEQSELGPVLARLEQRGPDGSQIMTDRSVGLGHALLATTPEALTEQLPLTHPETHCTITADVRLDNREELIEQLDSEATVGDAQLILRAYLKWGLSCLDHLLGDFAFAIWDPREQHLFCARDQVGMRQLIYHHANDKLFAFATTAPALLAHPEVPDRINRARIADFLEWLEAIDDVSTFHEGLLRLPPAHAMVVRPGGLRMWRYWQLTAPGPERRASDEEHEAAFLDVFAKAVRTRLRAPDGVVGSMLSGGVDSGSVTAIAARLLQRAGAPPLRTFSGIDTDPDCMESACIHASAAHIPNIDPCMIAATGAEDLGEELVRLTRTASEPFDGHMVLIQAVYLAAHQAGTKVMLDGVGGDTTFATGDMIVYYCEQGRFDKAWREAWAQERIWGKEEAPALASFARASRRKLAPEWLRKARRDAWEMAEAEQAARTSPLNDAFAAEVDMPARRAAYKRNTMVEDGFGQTARAQRMLHPCVLAGRERYDRVAGAVGIEPRDPFLDVRVLEFCLTLPIEQLHKRGWEKLILRRAMKGLLPESVLWKRGRDHVGWRFIEEVIGKPKIRKDDAVLSQFCRWQEAENTGDNPTMQPSADGVVSEEDVSYLKNWTTNS